ncbi:MAG: flagellar hook-basal body protein [Clostridiales bacterium]|nr:flagellar hook-basal body protein [Clostridiales bacterium]
MNVAFYSASTGLIQTQRSLNMTANNIANVNTPGYKAMRSSFADLIYTNPKNGLPQLQEGHGAHIAKTDLMFSIGQLEMTDQLLDFAIPSEGFFAVMDGSGTVAYTKDGSFSMSEMGGTWYLVNKNGDRVLDNNSLPIAIQNNDYGEIDYSEIVNAIGVFTFDNPYGIEAVGDNLYMPTNSSGQPVANPNLDKLAGALERSNVDLANEMIKTIETQRAYQLNARIVQTADELERIANSLR